MRRFSGSVTFSLLLFMLFCLFVSASQGQVSFFAPPTYTVGGPPLFVADFNGDRKPDLLGCSGNGCVVQLGNGNGTFAKGLPPVQGQGAVLAVADFNGDGKPDLLEQGTGTLLVLLGKGDGTFQAPISTNTGAGTLNAVVAGDMRGNGINDVLGLYNNNLVVFLGKGDGTFTAVVFYPVGNTNTVGSAITLGDFNGDGKTDVVVSLSAFPGTEVTFLGNGDGTLQSPKTSTGVNDVSNAFAGDFNGDGKLDLVIAEGGGGCYPGPCPTVILLGNGDGTFQAPVLLFLGAANLAVADVNGDGKPDLVGVSSLIQIYLGNGDGTFSNPYSYEPSGTATPQVAIADFNLDGKLDIAATGAVLLGNGNGSFQGLPAVPIPFAPYFAVTGNFTKNGVQDVAVVDARSLNLGILLNDGTGVLTLAHTYTLQQLSGAIAAADLNGDGNLDLIVAGNYLYGGSYSILLGNGDGSFQPPMFTTLGLSGQTVIVVADFNNDHIPDVAFSAAGGDSVAVLFGKGDGTFGVPNYVFDGGGTTLAAADFNGDGNVDLVSSNVVGNANEFAILFGNGDGTFQPASFPSAEAACVPSFAADLNRDGKIDLVGTNGGIEVCLGNGDGTFKVLPPIDSPAYGIGAIADMNGDGVPDLVAGYSGRGGSATAGVYLGYGDGTFGPFIDAYNYNYYGPSPSLFDLASDMNDDGKPDLVLGSIGLGSTSGSVFVVLNTTPAGFTVSATALSPATVTAGNSASSTITVKPNFGFSGTVVFSCSGLPSGAGCSFNPPSLMNASGTSKLTVTTSSGTAAGTYPLGVNGVSGGVKSSASLTLVVQLPPGFTVAATALSPASVAAGGSATSTITVTSVGGFNQSVTLSCSSILLNGSAATKAPPRARSIPLRSRTEQELRR